MCNAVNAPCATDNKAIWNGNGIIDKSGKLAKSPDLKELIKDRSGVDVHQLARGQGLSASN